MLVGAIMAFASIFVPATRLDPIVTTQTPEDRLINQVRCHKCSALNPDYAIYCNICGNKLQ
jgi:ribosomal protein L40E